MLTLTGLVENAFITNSGVGDDGKPYGGKHKVQLLSRDMLRNGETKVSLIDLTVRDSTPYKSQIGHEVSIEVGAMVLGNAVHLYTISEGQALK